MWHILARRAFVETGISIILNQSGLLFYEILAQFDYIQDIYL